MLQNICYDMHSQVPVVSALIRGSGLARLRGSRTTGKGPGCPDLGGNHPPAFLAGCSEEAPDGLVYRLTAQTEGRVMDRQHMMGAQPSKHEPRLLGRGMVGEDAVVRGDVG
jgi:hypothetical protein